MHLLITDFLNLYLLCSSCPQCNMIVSAATDDISKDMRGVGIDVHLVVN
ncbi:unnamed protein product [Brugia timori]|uniref:40S ribosomal protein S18 n=1 Tax=Brugia timori TaxID=42155 RepID=A0A0R3QWS7_9BILA|nr:unnamed protein product [Brugia timori]